MSEVTKQPPVVVDEAALAVVRINELELDKECVRLPGDYLKYAHLAVDQKRDVDEAKATLDMVQADIGKKVRDMPAKYGLEKVTEAGIQSAVLTSEDYQKALARLNRRKHQQERTQAVVWSLEHKKRSLTLLVELHGMGYFSNPKLSEKGKAAIQDMTATRPRRKAMDQD